MKSNLMLTATAAKKTMQGVAFLVTTINTDLTMEQLAGGFVDTLLNLASYGGSITIVLALIAWGYAHKNGESGGQDKAVTAGLIGILFVGLRGVLEFIGILK